MSKVYKDRQDLYFPYLMQSVIAEQDTKDCQNACLFEMSADCVQTYSLLVNRNCQRNDLSRNVKTEFERKWEQMTGVRCGNNAGKKTTCPC